MRKRVWVRALLYALTCTLNVLALTTVAGAEATVTLQLSEADYLRLASEYKSCDSRVGAEIAICERIQKVLLAAAVRRARGAHAGPDHSVLADAPGAVIGRPPAPPAQVPVEATRIFVRADPIDNFWYLVTPDISTPKGASISYTDNQAKATQSATINGIVSYVLIPGAAPSAPGNETFQSVSALAAFVYGNGSWNEPLTTPANQAVKAGFDYQYRLVTPWKMGLRDVYFNVDPYVLTDFRTSERADGVSLAFEPVVAQLALGAGVPFDDYLTFLWILRPELDERWVSNPGVTAQTVGTYAWAGATARAYLALFPFQNDHYWGPYLENRFTLIGTVQFFSDYILGSKPITTQRPCNII